MKLIKGILVWFTALSYVLFFLGLESMMDNKKYLIVVIWFLFNALLSIICHYSISVYEFTTVTGARWLNRNINL